MRPFQSIDSFRAEARKHNRPQARVRDGEALFRVSTFEPKALDPETRSIRYCFSDGSIDRMGDTIAADGWELTDFLANPIALWAHDSSSPPIGKAFDVSIEGPRLMGTIAFAAPDVYSFSDTIYRLAIGKFIRAVSVGFIPIEYSFVENDPDRGWGIDFKRQELLEISVCPVPANPHALEEARAKGIDTRPLKEWAERCLDENDSVMLSRAELNRLRKIAKEPPMRTARRRADDDPDDKPDDDKVVGNCGRSKDQECGMKSIAECSVHGTKAADGDDDKPTPDEEKQLKRLLRLLAKQYLPPRRKADDGEEDPPLPHEDAIRMAHKCMRTAKSFITEGLSHHAKGVDMLQGVVDALNEGGSDDDKPEDKEMGDDDGEGGKPDDEKAAHLLRAAALRATLKPVA